MQRTDVSICGVSVPCIQAEALRLLVIVAHAPSPCNVPSATVEAYWAYRAKDLARRPPGHDFLMLTDANASVGSIRTDRVGSCDPETETAAGEILHDFLQDAFLPTTYHGIHSENPIPLN